MTIFGRRSQDIPQLERSRRRLFAAGIRLLRKSARGRNYAGIWVRTSIVFNASGIPMRREMILRSTGTLEP